MEGALVEPSAALVVEALGRAAAAPDGLPLFAGKSSPGLFASTPTARQAAQRCKDEGLLRVLRAESKGKSAQEICTITDKGLAYVLDESSPRALIEELNRTLDTRGACVQKLVQEAQQVGETFQTLRGVVEKLVEHLQKSADDAQQAAWPKAVLAHLKERQEKSAVGDCPLPSLYRQARETAAALTVGQFHDGLRQLYEQQAIYLHPWTGPLYDLPEPALALLVGHEVAYYASVR
jgi:hypothetical protein